MVDEFLRLLLGNVSNCCKSFLSLKTYELQEGYVWPARAYLWVPLEREV